ncbi:hypothetical protein [Humidisolicoccus flavus]|uniref:hypothetical protein n=1 Tax=Humidisolicoccus flavus TaxID=3111414 RepID=UPI0032440916
MANKNPASPRPYRSFNDVAVDEQVDIRLVGEDAYSEPLYVDAELFSSPSSRQFEASFWVPSLGFPVTLSEKRHVAWSKPETS